MHQTSFFHSAVLAALTVASPYQVAAQVTGDESNETSASSGGIVEEVIVYGIQQSLESALEQKRQQKNLIEVINAEDIGKMPDENLAEVLENIPGVQISRNAGIGSSVAVRGSEDNRVEINGRGTTPAGDNRGGMSFEDLPAALVRSLNVVKVPTADMVEGSIGGTIDVKTYRGLRLKERLAVFRAAAEYAENAEAWNQNFSATVGDKFSTQLGDVGAIVTFNHIEKTVREDSLRVSPGIRQAAQSNVDFNGDGIGDAYYKPGFGDLLFGVEDRENTAVSASLEWQYSNDLKLFTEVSYTDFSRLNLGQSMFIGAAGGDQELDGTADATFGSLSIAGVSIPMLTSGIIGGGVRNGGVDLSTETGGPNDGLRLRSNNRAGSRDTESYLAAIGGEWDSDDVKVEFEVSAAGSDTQEASFTTVFQFNDPTATNFHSAGAAIRVPFYYDYRDGVLQYGPTGDRVTTTQLLDPNYYSLFIARDQDSFFDNEETAATVDVTWFRNNGMWQEIKAGIRISDRSI
ncbi:MAG: TonB-dependent receptor plug domain-containing protein, partial [Pseudomonadota bacterium]|nr:TonB-dependent receptor plug domain-containing protein [Pseudomonadota bacterium]